MIRAGTLRDRITIEARIDARDAFGAATPSWAAIAGGSNIAAAVVSSKGDESMRAAAIGSVRTIKFLVRYIPGVTPDMRVVFGGADFDIYDVDETKRLAGALWITATAQVA